MRMQRDAEFEGCTVTVTADLLNASIVFHNQTR